ncbi:MAG: hypothetical protein JNN21_13880 [Candidatus Accumulibacter sp.]|nr:hypothetical protein [Accumulibacter sp.]HRD94224.1 hypothetical protein [Accumulibacter sp.]
MEVLTCDFHGVFGRHLLKWPSPVADPAHTDFLATSQAAMCLAFRHFNTTLVAWAMRKYRRLKGHKIRASRFLEQLSEKKPYLFVHWQKGEVAPEIRTAG